MSVKMKIRIGIKWLQLLVTFIVYIFYLCHENHHHFIDINVISTNTIIFLNIINSCNPNLSLPSSFSRLMCFPYLPLLQNQWSWNDYGIKYFGLNLDLTLQMDLEVPFPSDTRPWEPRPTYTLMEPLSGRPSACVTYTSLDRNARLGG